MVWSGNREGEERVAKVRDVAVTTDGWTSVPQDDYLTVSIHYNKEGSLIEKILLTQAVSMPQIKRIYYRGDRRYS